MRRALVPLFALLLVLLAPALVAQPVPADALPPGVDVVEGSVAFAHWRGTQEARNESGLAPGGTGSFWFAVAAGNASAGNATLVVVNLTGDALGFGNATLSIPVPAGDATPRWSLATTTFTLAANASGEVTYRYTVDVLAEDANGTRRLSSDARTATLAVLVPAPPEEPGVPTTWLVGGGAAVVVGAGAALYALKRRRERELMNAAPRRSRVMREMELEKKLERIEEKDPEAAQEIKQEIRAQEQVREKRRELQILEAKRADALKTIDLLTKRHEAGALTRHQYDNMVAKKRADLERIEREIAEMEAQDAAGGAAA